MQGDKILASLLTGLIPVLPMRRGRLPGLGTLRGSRDRGRSRLPLCARRTDYPQQPGYSRDFPSPRRADGRLRTACAIESVRQFPRERVRIRSERR